MRRNTIIAIIIVFVLTIGASALWSARSDRREGDPDANALIDDGAKAGASDDKKLGTKLAKIFGAPVRAVGHLFHRKDDGLPRRMTEKDARKFESAHGLHVADSTSNGKASGTDANSTARDHLANGRALLASGRVNEAVTELSTAVSLDPSLSEAYDLLGVAYDRKGMPERAKDEYEKAIRNAPADAQALNNLGFSLELTGTYHAAVDRLRRAAMLAPPDDRVLSTLGLAPGR